MERLIGDDSLQTPIFVLKRAHLGDVADFHTAELGFPGIECRGADAMPSAKIFRRRAGFVFFEDTDDLHFTKPRLLHGGLLRGQRPQDSPPIFGSPHGMHVILRKAERLYETGAAPR